MSEPQLERSVLEAKEREELYAIADALGTKPGSRAKKADLITQILRATGIEPDVLEPAEKPRRTRVRKAVSEPAGAAERPDDANGDEATSTAAVAQEPATARAGNGRTLASRSALRGTDDSAVGGEPPGARLAPAASNPAGEVDAQQLPLTASDRTAQPGRPG